MPICPHGAISRPRHAANPPDPVAPKAMSRPTNRRLPLLYLLPLFCALLLGALWTAVLLRIGDEQEAARENAQAESQAFVRIYEEHTVRLLRQVDQASRFLKMEFERNDGFVDLAAFAGRKGLLPADLAPMITIVDARGEVVTRTHDEVNVNLRAREYFQAHVEADQDDLYIGRPVIGRVTRQWSIPLSRRLNNADGSFAGIILIALNPLTLYTDYDAPFLGKHGSVGLLGEDDVFRIRRIGESTRFAETVDFSAFKRGYTGGNHGSFTRASPIDGVRRIYSFRRLKDFPLFAIAGLAEEDAFAGYYRNRSIYLWSAALGSLFILGFTAFLMLQSRALERSRRAASQAQTIYQAAASGSLDAFYLLEAIRDREGRVVDFRFVEVNHNGATLIGMPPARIIGQPLCELIPVNRSAGFFDKYLRVLETGVPLEEEFEIDAPQIGARWLRHQVVCTGPGIAITSRDISERKQQEFQLRARRAEMHAVNDSSPLGLFRLDLQGNVTYANRSCERITGLSGAEILGRNWIGMVHPRDRQALFAASLRLARRGTPLDLTHRVLHADGRELWLALKVAPIRVDERVTGYVGSLDDITERRATMQSRRMLATIIEAGAQFVAITDPKGRVTYLNPAARRTAGLAPEADVTGTHVSQYYPPRVYKRMVEEAMPASLREGIWIGESTVYDAQRREVPIHHMIIAHRGQDGQLEYFSGVMRDISAEKAAEQALRDSETRMRIVTDTVPAMVSFVGRDERYRFVNRAYELAFDRPREQIVGMTVRELHGEEAYPQLAAHVHGALAGNTVVFERDETEAGQYRCFETTFIPQTRAEADGSSTVLGFHVMKQDITTRKLQEKRLIEAAQVDSMTGLTNRAGFHAKLAELMARSRAQGSLLALMYLDIDHFKSVNDSFGHPAGDALLKAFAGRMTRSVRDTDVVARLGGDEFVIILPDLRRPEDATAVAAKVVAVMRPPFALAQQTLRITTSVGLAFFQGGGLHEGAGEDMNMEALIQRADEMLYQSKAAGRDTYHVAPLLRMRSAA
jgi:diguanylate cyclase (GGDEF)-like protein/PAS domain S-box-containing protein